jgi:hypothetical protein
MMRGQRGRRLTENSVESTPAGNYNTGLDVKMAGHPLIPSASERNGKPGRLKGESRLPARGAAGGRFETRPGLQTEALKVIR